MRNCVQVKSESPQPGEVRELQALVPHFGFEEAAQFLRRDCKQLVYILVFKIFQDGVAGALQKLFRALSPLLQPVRIPAAVFHKFLAGIKGQVVEFVLNNHAVEFVLFFATVTGMIYNFFKPEGAWVFKVFGRKFFCRSAGMFAESFREGFALKKSQACPGFVDEFCSVKFKVMPAAIRGFVKGNDPSVKSRQARS